ncbi:hypothetical protein [Natrarchaeobius oligotrophus]|uniref:Uncharacterized protein n=1 Tax=Natrarchaeobius chitinivorans TaxID=1679083 RepID=A0A3N6MQ67_NATCH|nr:hypothetical protein [Natrarchaeobius chitinivorans]RQG96716.1 hypothetical protein EA472_20395 [Natrarchaeobius chitinivorans]
MIGVFVVVALFVLATTVGLYVLIAAETSNPTVVDRETAEREARARSGRSPSEPDRDRISRDRSTGTDDRRDADGIGDGSWSNERTRNGTESDSSRSDESR